MINRLKKYKIGTYIYILIFIIMLLINIYDINDKLNANDINKIPLIIYTAIIMLLGILFLFSIKKYDYKSIDKYFLTIGLLLGATYLFISPVFTGSDEHNHYYRIYEITEGKMITPTDTKTVGSKMPSALKDTFISGGAHNTKIRYKSINKMINIKVNNNDRTQYGKVWTDSYVNTALYSPVQYLPQIVGFSIGKLLKLDTYKIGILGRITNFLFYIVIGFFIIKYNKNFKLYYFLVMLSPNMLQCATTLSADAFTNAIFLALLCIITNNYKKKSKDKRIISKILLFVTSIILACCKIVYIPFVLGIVLFSINSKNKVNKKDLFFCIFTIIVACIISLLWIRTTKAIFDISYDKYILQKQFILNHPIRYGVVLLRTLVEKSMDFIECLFIGTTMYHSQVSIPAIISFSYVFIVVLSFINEKKPNNYSSKIRLFFTLMSIIVITLVCTAIYMQCTAQFHAVGNSTIIGIQGRYFIPIIMTIPIIINNKINNKMVDEKELIKSFYLLQIISVMYIINCFII